jgi:sugar lactone lactonase YvrE
MDSMSPDQPIDADTSACTTADLSFGGANGLVIAGDGTLYFTQGSHIGRVRPCQAPETSWVEVGVTALNSVMVDPPNHALYVGALNADMIYKVDLTAATPSAAPYAAVDGPDGLTLGPDGALWASTQNGVARIAAANSATTVTTATLNNPKGLAFRPDGSLLVMEYGGTVYAVQLANHVETSRSVFAEDNGAFGGVIGIALDVDGNVYMSQGDGGPIVVVLDAAGNVIDSLEDGLGSQIDFGAGPLAHTDLYVAESPVPAPRQAAGATVPWHAL